MKELIEFLTNPLVIKVIVGYWVFSAFVGAMPSPDDATKQLNGSALTLSGKLLLLGYRCLFAFLHGLSGNMNRAAIAFKVPGAAAE